VLEYPRDQQPPFTIVGIVRDSKYNGLREDKVEPMAWAPLEQWPQRRAARSPIRTEAGRMPRSFAAHGPCRRTVDPDLMVRKVTTLERTGGRHRRQGDHAAATGIGFSAVALSLAAVGLYGTMDVMPLPAAGASSASAWR
jgi:hypothetical protein